MGILVLFTNNVYDIVEDNRLESLIAEKKIIGFRRSAEWVQVERDQVRIDSTGHFDKERRGNGKPTLTT